MYGTVELVAGLARVWTHDGAFYNKEAEEYPAGTNPTYDTVETWLKNLSAQMDVALGSQWFDSPVTQASEPGAYAAISQYIAGLASDLVHRANGVDVEVSPQGKILRDMTAWVKENADGLVAGGAHQKTKPSLKTQIKFRTVDFP